MTTARESIKGLTNAWYGFAICSGGLALVQGGFGLFSIVSTAFSVITMIVITWFLGNRLLAKSSLTRFLLLVVSGIASVAWTFGVAKMGWMFLHDWSLKLLFGMLFGASSAYMHVRSFRTLTSASVRAYFG